MMRCTVLVIDPSESNLELMRVLLERAGIGAFLASDGRSALHILEQVQPDLIITETRVPDLGGVDLIRALKLSMLPIVVVTGSVMAEDRRKAYEAGCDAFFAKPLDLVSFLEYVESRLSRVA